MTLVKTFLRIETEDAQGVKNTMEWWINDSDFGATTLPSRAKIEAVVAAIFGETKFSDQKVLNYEVAVREEEPTATGGNGDAATSTALRARNSAGDPVEESLNTIPGLNKANVTYDPRNRSSVSTSGSLWTAIRAALVDAEIGIRSPSGGTYPSDQIWQTATTYDGKRRAPQPS